MRVTRGMITDAPRKAVLGTAELLEEIMLHLPAKTVFASQRVCRLFRDTVQTSIRIKQKLFLLPSDAERVHWGIEYSTPLGAQNWWSSSATARYVHITDKTTELKQCTPVRLNPLLKHRLILQSTAMSALRVNSIKVTLDLRKGLARENASYRQTFLTEPPCSSATVSFRWSLRSKPGVSGSLQQEVEDTSGITLGTLIDTMMRKKGYVSYASGGQWKGESDTSLQDILDPLEKASGKKVFLDPMYTHITLNDVAVPTEEEWDAMK